MATKPPTPEEVKACIAHFEDIAPKIRQDNAFGDSNRDLIDAQIETLKNHEDYLDSEAAIDAIDGTEDDEATDLRGCIEAAYEWAENGTEDTDSDVPFPQSWDSLIVN